MSDQALVITIDGPAGSGKSTVARRIADELGIPFLDTGAMYRALAWAALHNGVGPDDEGGLVRLFDRSTLRLAGDGRVLWDETDITQSIRLSDVTSIVSKVASLPEVRGRMVVQQRAIAGESGVVAEGRDQGTVVFPDADHKFFLDADLTERTRRRARDLESAGEEVDEESLVDALDRRDRADRQREVSPLLPPPDAVLIDSTRLSIDEVCDRILAAVRGEES